MAVRKILIMFIAAFLCLSSVTEISVKAENKLVNTIKLDVPVVADNTNINLRKYGYLSVTDNGYMRLIYDGEKIVIENYDSSFQLQNHSNLSMELPIWGGFYKGNDAYYLVEGQSNKDGIDGTEVLRIIKYDFNWNRIGSGSIQAKKGWEYEIRYPFDHSCVNMTEVDGKLYVATGRQGYVDPNYNQGHQGMMLIRMDETSFDTEIAYGDFAHSFSQYIDHNGTDIYILECSEGGRYTSLSRFDSNRTGTDYFNAFEERFSVLNYGGSRTSAWAIPCYASADDIAISDTNVLGLGTSIDQSQYDNVSSSTSHNIYLTVTPLTSMNHESTTVKWLTNFKDDGKSFLGVNITKVNDNRFMVLWEEYVKDTDSLTLADQQDALSFGTIHYLFIDGNGNKISDEYTASAVISDCKPILNGNKIVYFASNDNTLDFYTIDAQTGKFEKNTTRIAGDNITWDFKDGVLTFTGEGAIEYGIDTVMRYPVSSANSGYVYYSGDNCWRYLRDSVTEIKIGEGITSIPDEAFAYFKNLKTVTLSEGMLSIGEKAFYSCGALRNITIPDSVTTIGDDILWTGYFWTSDNSHVVYAKIHGGCNSYAKTYAKDNDISYIVDHHNWGERKVVKEALYTQKGLAETVCQSCGEKKTEDIPAKSKIIFKDVLDPKVSYYNPVYWAVEKGITTGTSDTTFSPGNSCTRAQFVTFLWRQQGKPEPKMTESPFTDVQDPSLSYYKAVLWALENEITTGTSPDTFSPGKPCTRAQVVTFLWRANGKPAPTAINPFTDVKEGLSYSDAVLWAYEKKITTGKSDTSFAPGDPCTRAQTVTFLYRTYAE